MVLLWYDFIMVLYSVTTADVCHFQGPVVLMSHLNDYVTAATALCCPVPAATVVLWF